MVADRTNRGESGGGLAEGISPLDDKNDPGADAGGTPAEAGEPSGGMMTGAMTMSGINDENIAAEAASLGAADGAMADAASGADHHVSRGTGGEALRGAGLGEPGSGTPGDKGDLGGGGASLGQGAGTGPAGSGRTGG